MAFPPGRNNVWRTWLFRTGCPVCLLQPWPFMLARSFLFMQTSWPGCCSPYAGKKTQKISPAAPLSPITGPGDFLHCTHVFKAPGLSPILRTARGMPQVLVRRAGRMKKSGKVALFSILPARGILIREKKKYSAH